MLTKTERRFVEAPDSFSKSQRRLYRHRINKKILALVSDLRLMAGRNEKLGLNLALLAEFSNKWAFQNPETGEKNGPDRNATAEGKSSLLAAFVDW